MAFNKQKALEKAEKYAAKGQHDKAAREYRAVVDNDPKDIRAWLMLADCLVRCGEKPEAVERYIKVADSYASQKQPQKAVAVFRQILNLDPSRLDIQLKVATLNRELGRIPDAVSGFELVAQAQMQAGRVKEALAAYQLAAEAEPSSISKRLRLAELYSREQMIDEAVDSFRVAAGALLDQDRKDDYVRVAERLVYHKKDDIEALRELAQVYLEIDEPRRALMKLNALLHVEATDPRGLELLADTFGALDKTDKAVSVILELSKALQAEKTDDNTRLIRVLRKGLAWDPNNAEIKRALDDLGIDDDDIEEIEELEVDDSGVVQLDDDDVELEELPEEDSDAITSEQPLTQSVLDDVSSAPGEEDVDVDALGDVDKIVYEARVYIKYKLYDHALEHLGTVLEEEPEHAGALSLQARALRESGRDDEAAEAYVAIALVVAPTDPKLAREHLRAAIECDPSHEDATALLGRLERGESLGGEDFDEMDVNLDSEPIDLDEQSSSSIQLALDAEKPANVIPAFEEQEEEAFEELESESVSPTESADFAIELQEGEPVEPEAEPVPVENRFGLSEAKPLPKKADDEPEVEELEDYEELEDVEPAAEPEPEPEQDWPDISDEVAEIRFFADQGLDDDVEFSLGDLDRRFPGHPEVASLRAELSGGAEPPVDEEAAKPLVSFEDEDEDEDAFLEAMLSGEPAKKEASAEAEKAGGIGARAEVEDADAGTYYDLGTAYREMGLVDDAITQFELAAGDATWRTRALVMLGGLRVHRGETDRAIEDLKNAIEASQNDDERNEAHYELGGLFEKIGNTESAIEHFDQVGEGFRDREERLAALRG